MHTRLAEAHGSLQSGLLQDTRCGTLNCPAPESQRHGSERNVQCSRGAALALAVIHQIGLAIGSCRQLGSIRAGSPRLRGSSRLGSWLGGRMLLGLAHSGHLAGALQTNGQMASQVSHGLRSTHSSAWLRPECATDPAHAPHTATAAYAIKPFCSPAWRQRRRTRRLQTAGRCQP